ncbi:prepilin-type N-terminal cleavage/methylation domain-containing protein [Candidatus Vampirococcus lugosii]|uniref:Prepilin-type N-terminal cleavage/methylation domain-containing protein n=1 Tax=Candidatus Vampirococcus lugosii TaxID=2789015 RepID=A0ABS5QMQ2_9BACT|nr:prepilin-type N-terminal cleavage/methylation domain-containing protein [Candidatus Vampirococcus lugosii]MBS8122491.1 hypothetical protein [Candidatus Vampirococcus lugosii]
MFFNKKINYGFTLIEIVLVIIIISIILIFIIFYGYGQIKTTQFRIDKQSLIDIHQKVHSSTLGSNIYYGERFDYLKLKLEDQSDNINLYISGANSKMFYERTKLNNSYISGFNYSQNLEDEIYLNMKAYELSCSIESGADLYTGGNLYFDLISTNGAEKYCFDINLSSCKIFEYKCD